MKNILCILSLFSLTIALSSCNNNAHDGAESGLAVTLISNNGTLNDEINDVTIWFFDANDILVKEFQFDNPIAVAKNLLQLSEGTYSIIAVTNMANSFSHNANINVTTLQELLININESSSSPIHSHYGLGKATVNTERVSRVEVQLNRSMAQMQFSIRNTPAEVVSAHLQMLNSSKGYYPGISRLHSDVNTVDFGQGIPINGNLLFSSKNVMPTVATTVRSDNVQTQMQLSFIYANGGELSFTLEAPALLNGGEYSPEISYSALRPGKITVLSSINGWVELPPKQGEILNPDR